MKIYINIIFINNFIKVFKFFIKILSFLFKYLKIVIDYLLIIKIKIAKLIKINHFIIN